MLSDHSGEVVGVALHPTNKYFITASADRSWAFYDLDSMLCMAQVCFCCSVLVLRMLCHKPLLTLYTAPNNPAPIFSIPPPPGALIPAQDGMLRVRIKLL